MNFNIKEIQDASRKANITDEQLITLIAALPKPKQNRKFTLEQYKNMADRFNKMSFSKKIETIRENKDILTLCADGNWWGVKVKDNEIQEQLYDSELQFNITNEWGSSEMYALIFLLEMELTDI